MENSYRYFENRACEYYPCHQGIEHLNCLFCYCPLFNQDNCPGKPKYVEREGHRMKDCSGCDFPHHLYNYNAIVEKMN